MTHICVGNVTIIGSDNGLSPDRRQAIIWNNDGILLFGPVGWNFSEILIKIYTFSFKKINLRMALAKWRPFCLGLNVLSDPDFNAEEHMINSYHGNAFSATDPLCGDHSRWLPLTKSQWRGHWNISLLLLWTCFSTKSFWEFETP